MNLNKCLFCSNELSKELNEEKYICSSRLCQSSFEIMDADERDNHNIDERAVISYKVNTDKELHYCQHCGEELTKRCSMPTIGSHGKRKTTIFTCSNSECNLEYHVTESADIEDNSLNNFKIVEIYKESL